MLGRGWCAAIVAVLVSCVAVAPAAAQGIIRVDRDDVVVQSSAIIEFTDEPIVDDEGDGVVHIVGDDVVVRLTGRLRGAAEDADPDTYTGIGIRIDGRNVTVAGGTISGFKVGLSARRADGLQLLGMTFADNFRQRLQSTPQAEAAIDWLRPHDNDDGEWASRYGAAVRIVETTDATVFGTTVRDTQNGIMLERVDDSKVVECDASFLSGWGLALWRSTRNVVTRNAFDFCVRGYSHGVYNRGQDSAGILMFEQCSDNWFVQNSATHGGDGFFGFSGSEALGQRGEQDPEWHERRGHVGNVFVDNDFSYAAAHGLELTFAFGSRIHRNRLVGNAICGIWGGFSQDLVIDANEFEANGDAGYGLERGGVNIEHGRRNLITGNRFTGNACGVHLWWDPADELVALPWGQANDPACEDNVIAGNLFEGNTTGIHLRAAGTTYLGAAEQADDGPSRDLDAASRAAIRPAAEAPATIPTRPGLPPDVTARLEAAGIEPGVSPIGRRAHLAGRQHIVMTEWGPWDGETPFLRLVERRPIYDVYTLVSNPSDPISLADLDESAIVADGPVRAARRNDRVAILPIEQPLVSPYTLEVRIPGRERPLTASGVVRRSQWNNTVFIWETDPRVDEGGWRADAMRTGIDVINFGLRHDFGYDGPSQASLGPFVRRADLPVDRFGILADTALSFLPGTYRIVTRSDDGIRVLMDGETIIEDWTLHAPRRHEHVFTVTEERLIGFEIAYFEIEGYATVTFDVEVVDVR